MPGAFNKVRPCFKAKPERGLNWPSTPLGISKRNPVGINSRCNGANDKPLERNSVLKFALKSAPAAPSVSKLKKNRPKIVMGFAAETENILENAKSKLIKKGCDFIVANDVSLGSQTMGGNENTAVIVSKNDVETLPRMSKRKLAKILVEKISRSFEDMDA